jgi:catechol 2,3-dioxygenase-like lactoylglutathione lyase family enzyme
MEVTLHHCHLFASDIEKSIRFYQEMFGAQVIMDAEIGGSRNVLISIGKGLINFYDQPPRDTGRGAVHHLGIHTDDLEALVEHMKSKGYQFRKQITDLGILKYVMIEAPDNLLIELFETAQSEKG